MNLIEKFAENQKNELFYKNNGIKKLKKYLHR